MLCICLFLFDSHTEPPLGKYTRFVCLMLQGTVSLCGKCLA